MPGVTGHAIPPGFLRRYKERDTLMAVENEQFDSSDQPITSHEKDRFDRWPFAQRIAETIARRRETSSMVIGIYGRKSRPTFM
jgi:hypothetical protein